MTNIKEILLLWFLIFLIKSLKVVVLTMKLKKINNQQRNYINQLLKNSKEEKYVHHMKKIFGADLADIQLISKFNKAIRFLLSVIDIFSKYAWVIPLKMKKVLLL